MWVEYECMKTMLAEHCWIVHFIAMFSSSLEAIDAGIVSDWQKFYGIKM